MMEGRIARQKLCDKSIGNKPWNLALSDYQLFFSLKEKKMDEKPIKEVIRWKSFYTVVQKRPVSFEKCVRINDDYVEK